MKRVSVTPQVSHTSSKTGTFVDGRAILGSSVTVENKGEVLADVRVKVLGANAAAGARRDAASRYVIESLIFVWWVMVIGCDFN
jgi:hypothetical protein